MKRAFILKSTLIVMFFTTALFYLVRIWASNRVIGDIHSFKSSHQDILLENIQEVITYELAYLDSEITSGKLSSIEEYFFLDRNGNSILRSYSGFTENPEKNIESIGGYRVSYVTPEIREIYISGLHTFTMRLSKNVTAEKNGETVMSFEIRTGNLKVQCRVEVQDKTVYCNDFPYIGELTIVGES